MLPSVRDSHSPTRIDRFFFFSLDLFRDGEKYYLLSLEAQPMIDTYLYLAKVYLRLDQPLLAISRLQEGVKLFPHEPCLIQAVARIHEVCFP